MTNEQGYSAADMATASADGFRAGVASVIADEHVLVPREPTRWIAVDDALPELGTPVWLTDESAIWIGGRQIVEDGDEDSPVSWGWCKSYSAPHQRIDGTFDCDLEYDDDYAVTRWMPLPYLLSPAPTTEDSSEVAEPAQASGLPSLPDPIDAMIRHAWGPRPDTYTADQMHAYARAAIAALQQPSGWQPIETAPTDGTRVLLLYDGGRRVGGYWNNDKYANRPRPYWSHDHEHIWGTREARAHTPTHWMPLPNPPQVQP